MQQQERADRILDAAGELMLRMGYRKVTIEDVARRVGIGKGTVYLHWRTKRQLFEALLLREALRNSAAIVERLRDDPEQVQPHRFMRTSFELVQRQPLLQTMFTGDPDLLGTLADASQYKRSLVDSEKFYGILIRHGLVRADIPNLQHALEATVTGFFLVGNVVPDLSEVPAAEQSASLADTLRHAFEPTAEPSATALRAAAAEVLDLFENSIAAYRDEVYTPDSAS